MSNVIQIRDKDGNALYPITEASLVIGMEPGIGFDTITTPATADGTALITLTNGDTITLDLNHDHTAYPKYTVCTQAEYDAIVTKDSDRLYLIPEV